jgi:hypothetical protein
MTHDAPPPMPDFPPPSPPPAPKKPRNWVIIGSAAAVIAAVIGTGVFVVNSRDDDSRPAAAATSSAPSEDAVTAADTADPTPSYAEASTDDFSIDLKTKSKQCFGSAGCNMTVEPELTFLGVSGVLDPDAVYEITYEIRGDQSGPVIATAELTDQTSLSYTPSLISTASAGTKVSVEITDVTTQGG